MNNNLRGEEELSARRGIIKELFTPARSHYKRWPVVQKGIHNQFQCDLVILNQYTSQNKKYQYLLLCIDIFSKTLYARPLKTRSAKEVTQKMKEILDEIPRLKLLQTDEEKSFLSREFQALLKQRRIKHFYTFSKLKASIIERAILTFRRMLFPRLHLLGKFNWIDNFKSVIDTYNNKVHSKIKMKPIDVKKKHEKLLLQTVYKQKPNFKKPKFKVGDLVRVNLNHRLFTKRSNSVNWSTKIYRIKSFKAKNPHIYTLENSDDASPILGIFYTEELLKTNYPNTYLVEKILKRKPGKLFVKYLYMDNSENSWIDA